MKYLLDTNICIYLINQRSKKLLNRLKACPVGNVYVSSITVAELRYGAAKSQASERNNLALNQFLIPLEMLNFDDKAALSYGEVRTRLERKGTPIGPLDTLIAAQALANNLTLITNNMREFKRVSDLRAENWS